MKEYKRSPEFAQILAATETQQFVEGFYSFCSWVRWQAPQMEWNRLMVSTISHHHRYLPTNYLEEAQRVLEEELAEEEENRAINAGEEEEENRAIDAGGEEEQHEVQDVEEEAVVEVEGDSNEE